MARPRKYTDEEMIAAIKKTRGMVYRAAKRLGCYPDTIYSRARTSEAVREAMEFERGLFVETALQKLHAAVRKDKPWAIIFTLNIFGREYGFGRRWNTGPRFGRPKSLPEPPNHSLPQSEVISADASADPEC